jgi:hypothetical protein
MENEIEDVRVDNGTFTDLYREIFKIIGQGRKVDKFKVKSKKI